MTQTVSNEAAHSSIIPGKIASEPKQIDVVSDIAGYVATVDAPPLDGHLNEQMIDEIRDAWRHYPVLIFKQQRLDPVGLARFSEQLGQFGHDPYVRPLAQHANVIEVRREPEETTPIFGQSWHSDWSFQPRPPSGTLLQSCIIPPVGGDTVFANTYLAYETLSPAMQELLEPLRGVHSARAAYGPRGLFARDDHTRSMKIVVCESAENSCAHPLIRTHPESGKKALYINHVYTVGIEGFKEAESSALLKFLFRHMSQSAFTYRHRWQADTLLLWDNRCVIHYADGGYDGHRRLLYRTTLAGERPYQ